MPAVSPSRSGNRLLAAWGKQTQAHIELLLQDDRAVVIDDTDFVPFAGGTLLAAVQNAILDLTDPPRGSVAETAESPAV